MFTSAEDKTMGVVVWLMSGPSNSDDDYERYVASMIDSFRLAPGHRPAVAVLVVDPENPMPPASWRKRFAEASANAPSNVLFVLVSPSPIIRGVVTAIEWIRPSPYRVHACATFDEAVKKVAEARPALAVVLPGLLESARQKARSAG